MAVAISEVCLGAQVGGEWMEMFILGCKIFKGESVVVSRSKKEKAGNSSFSKGG